MDKGFLTKLVGELNAKYGDFIEVLDDELNASVKLEANNIVKFMDELKDNYGFDLLENLTAVDYQDKFVAVYSPVSTADNRQLLVKVDLPKDSNGDAEIPSLTGVWKAADVQEREVYDLMGIKYKNHPTLKRILLADDFEGHPLRKDYQMKKRV